MDFAFYDQSGAPSLGNRLLTPVRRLARRALRPAFHRLRELLERLAADQETDRQNVVGLARNLAADRADDLARAEQTSAHLLAELARLRQEVADARAESKAEAAGLRTEVAGLRAEVADVRRQLELARPLQADYHGLARRVDRVEDAAHAAIARSLGRAA